MTVLGIDVGWSTRHASTSLCLLTTEDGKSQLEFRDVGTDGGERTAALQSLTQGVPVDAVAVDGPLASDLRIVNEYRCAEALLSRGKFQKRGKAVSTKGGHGPQLHSEATWWAKQVVAEVKPPETSYDWAPSVLAVYEAFPNAFLSVLHPDATFPDKPVGNRMWTDTLYACPEVRTRLVDLANEIAPAGWTNSHLLSVAGHDRIAAFICALTAACAASGRYAAVGDPALGTIVLPSARFWGASGSLDGEPWASQELETNLSRLLGEPSMRQFEPGIWGEWRGDHLPENRAGLSVSFPG